MSSDTAAPFGVREDVSSKGSSDFTNCTVVGPARRVAVTRHPASTSVAAAMAVIEPTWTVTRTTPPSEVSAVSVA
jgi:hypothetical protein